jgi:phosphoribosyl-ATP pyrophosphohydrolase/phosphoribosyl-AMP cyclohydrolase
VTAADAAPRQPVFGDDGLVAAVVQDAVTARVLMLGWMSPESLALTRSTGRVHFWSRSRRTLWMKGEESGNVLEVVDLSVDCDGDAVLIRALPAGPTCHTGEVSCFDDPAAPSPPAQGLAWLEELWAVIAARTVDPPPGSYTASLLAGGVDAVARKVTEEATEVLLAAKDHEANERAVENRAAAGERAAEEPAAGDVTRVRVAEESADLLYHLLVLLAERGIEPAEVVAALRVR